VKNLDNPVQAEGAARGKENTPHLHNPVGVEHQIVAHLRRADLVWRIHTPNCATLVRGY